MIETTERGAVEAEIAALAQKIEEKRRLLEAEHGVVEEKELVRQAIGEKISEALGQASSAAQVAAEPSAALPVSSATPAPSAQSGPTYLDTLDDDTVRKINALVEQVFTLGLQKTIKTVVEEDPFVLDAFHDALVDKLYAELKKHKVVA